MAMLALNVQPTYIMSMFVLLIQEVVFICSYLLFICIQGCFFLLGKPDKNGNPNNKNKTSVAAFHLLVDVCKMDCSIWTFVMLLFLAGTEYTYIIILKKIVTQSLALCLQPAPIHQLRSLSSEVVFCSFPILAKWISSFGTWTLHLARPHVRIHGVGGRQPITLFNTRSFVGDFVRQKLSM